MRLPFVVMNADRAAIAVPWAHYLAGTMDKSLLVIGCRPGLAAPNKSVELAPPDLDELQTALAAAIEALGDSTVELLMIDDADPAEAICELIREQDITELIADLDACLPAVAAEMRFAGRLLTLVTCDVLLMDPSSAPASDRPRAVVPMGLPASGWALRAVVRVAEHFDAIIPILTVLAFSEDSRQLAEHEMDFLMSEAGVTRGDPGIEPIVVLAEGMQKGLAQYVTEQDVILGAGISVRTIRELRQSLIMHHPHGEKIAVWQYRPAGLGSRRLFGRLGRLAKSMVPELTLPDRLALFDRVQAGARVSPDFCIMIGLAVVIAALGLLADSTAVVIGAMLVAPLMTPLIGSGLAMAQGNVALFRRCLAATGYGLAVGLALSVLIGLIIPTDELPLEVISRGQPDLLDLLIAMFSGIAAAYAVSRLTVAESIVGVAVAAALVPPLACVGIAIAHGRWLLMQGAAVLLITNLAAISVGAALVFHWLGVPSTSASAGRGLWARRAIMGLIIFLVLLTAPLGYQMAERLSIGQSRPMGFPVSTRVAKVVQERVDQEEGIEVLMMGRWKALDGSHVGIILVSDQPISRALTEEIEVLVRKIRGARTDVDVYVLRNAVTGQVPMEEKPDKPNP